jgi:hypothetical protein
VPGLLLEPRDRQIASVPFFLPGPRALALVAYQLKPGCTLFFSCIYTLLASRGLLSAPTFLLLLSPPPGHFRIKGKDILLGHGAGGGTFLSILKGLMLSDC